MPPTDEQLAANLAAEIRELVGLDRDSQSLRAMMLRDALRSFAEFHRDLSASAEVQPSLFSALMSIVSDEAHRVQLMVDMKDSEVAIINEALYKAALEVQRARRLPRAA